MEADVSIRKSKMGIVRRGRRPGGYMDSGRGAEGRTVGWEKGGWGGRREEDGGQERSKWLWVLCTGKGASPLPLCRGGGEGGTALPALPSFVWGACSAQHRLVYEGEAERAALLLTFPPTTTFFFFLFLLHRRPALPSPCWCYSEVSGGAAATPPARHFLSLTEALPRSPPAFKAAWAGRGPPLKAASPPHVTSSRPLHRAPRNRFISIFKSPGGRWGVAGRLSGGAAQAQCRCGGGQGPRARRGGAQRLRGTFPGRNKRGRVEGWQGLGAAAALLGLFRGPRGDASRGAVPCARPARFEARRRAGGGRSGRAAGEARGRRGLPQGPPRRPGRCLRCWRFVPAGSGRASESRRGGRCPPSRVAGAAGLLEAAGRCPRRGGAGPGLAGRWGGAIGPRGPCPGTRRFEGSPSRGGLCSSQLPT